jgi:hypothetical protein
MRRLIPLVVALALSLELGAASVDTAAALPRGSGRTDLVAYRGLGTWVDVNDYVPAFQQSGRKPAVTTRTFDRMAGRGVKTVYLQGSEVDARSPGNTVDPKLLGRMLRAAHDADLRVVAWYLPRFADVNADFRRVRALLDFKSDGERFDGFALDIEANKSVPDVGTRNTALVDLSQRVRERAGNRPVGAIVLEPVFLEVVSAGFWPAFPWRQLKPLYDVWLPMSYWTNRNAESGYREGFRYTDENIRRLRNNLGDEKAPVHVIGGIGDSAQTKDYVGFVRAAKKDHAIGWSIYDYNTTASTAWPRLRKG